VKARGRSARGNHKTGVGAPRGGGAAGYASTPLSGKLGIKPNSTLALHAAPAGFRARLLPLPAGVRVAKHASGSADLTVWFVTAGADLAEGIGAMAQGMGRGLWIAWPKKSSGVVTDLTEHIVRRAALTQGLVDYKVCAISEVWSGLKFARRKK
jgi:hypothetical protein